MNDSKQPFGTDKPIPPSDNGQAEKGIPPSSQQQQQQHFLVGRHAPAAGPNYFRFMQAVGVPEPVQARNEPESILQPFYKRVNQAYWVHTFQYWFVACLVNILLLTQIIIGALVTSFGSSNRSDLRRAIVFLGGTNTVIAAVLAYFKSRNQPNRTRQFRAGLARVRDAVADAEADLRAIGHTLTLDLAKDGGAGAPNQGGGAGGAAGAAGGQLSQDQAAREAAALEAISKTIADLRKMYYDARNDAEANYPDLWVRYGDAVDQAVAKFKDTMKPKNPPPPPAENKAGVGGAGGADTAGSHPPGG